MDDHVPPRQEQEHIELIEVGSLDDVLAEFPTEASLLLDDPPSSPPRASDRLEDEFPSESSSIGEEPTEEPVEEFRSEVASAPVRVAAAHLRGPALAAVATLAVIAIISALGLGAFVRSRARAVLPATQASDVVLIAEPIARQSSAPVERLPPPLGAQTASIVRSTESRETRTPTPAPPPRRIVERSGSTNGTGLSTTPTLADREIPASGPSSSPVNTPQRTAADVPASSPVGTAGAPADAEERPAVERLADATVAAAGRPPLAPVVTPNNAIQRALAQYQSAFSQLDVAAVRQVWPTVDGKALAKAFDQLRQENLTFDSCELAVSGRTAVASCGGTTRYVPKVGNKSARVGRQQWRISLHQAIDAWVIDTVEVSPD